MQRTTKVLLYARYSTAMQSDASVEDQFRLLRQRAEREGWAVLAEHGDRAISGTVRDRPGLQECLGAIESGKAQILLAESLDRISRDQEDLAAIYKRVRYHGAKIITLSEGEIGSIHIGMGGTMSPLFLEQLGEKVRRGQIGRVEAGRIPGGISYGYRAVKRLGSDGELERGLREIDDEQAAIVRRIFADYAQGIGPKEIAQTLNAEGVPSPRGGLWRANAITGHRARRNGILNNDLYRGRILYNRQSFRKDPDSRKRRSRPNDQEDMISREVPELRIVDEETWGKVHERLSSYSAQPAHKARRPRRMLSGLLTCAECGGSVTIISTDRWGCSNRRQTGICTMSATITNEAAESRLYFAIQREMLHPEVVAAYLDELRIAAAEARREWMARKADREGRIAKLREEQRRITSAILDLNMPAENFRDRAHEIVAELKELEKPLPDLSALDEVVAHPRAIEVYKEHVVRLQELSRGNPSAKRQERQILTSLVDKIELAPKANGKQGCELIVHGQLAAILQLESKKPDQAKAQTGDCTPKMVAGVGFEPTTFRL